MRTGADKCGLAGLLPPHSGPMQRSARNGEECMAVSLIRLYDGSDHGTWYHMVMVHEGVLRP